MSPTRLAKFEEAIRTVLAFNEAFNRHDIAALKRQVSDDFYFESSFPAPHGATYRGKDEATEYWEDAFSRSPRIIKEIEDIFGFGNRCILRWRYLLDNATGEVEHIRGADIYRVQENLISEQLSYVKGEA